MIITRLCGGLGNQIFQYVVGRLVSERLHTELALDLSWFDAVPQTNTPRQYELHRYWVRARATTADEQRLIQNWYGPWLRRLPLPGRPWRYIREAGFDFDLRVLEIQDRSYLDGYWQSHLYADPLRPALLDELVPKVAPGRHDLRVASAIESSQAVSVHIRRGDYVSNSAAAQFHGLCSLDYYLRAIDLVKSRRADPHFMVFSDDAEWARTHLPRSLRATFVDHNTADNGFQDLRLMSLCRDHIIANSSFSWWGAWLSKSDTKLVIAPRQWFAQSRPTPTLMPEDWIRI